MHLKLKKYFVQILYKLQNMDKTAKGQNTLYNLQSKRTLPREVLKWIQGLDLSYSVKDYRKDLSNGFLIGEIISRYEPGKIPMHAFQNSHNEARRSNNWNLIETFFKKYELRKVVIQNSEYSKVASGSDPRSEQLFEFICRLYSVCTKRNMPQNAPQLDLPATQSKNPNLTASYLLREDGLEKLEKSQISHEESMEQKNLQERVPTRKISPNLDMPGQVDVKGVDLKQEINRKMTSKKKSWQAKSESFYVQFFFYPQEETNPYGEKFVFDYLNEILEQCLPSEQQGEQSSNLRGLFMNQKFKPTEILLHHLPLEQQFIITFFSEVKGTINDILPAMLKDINEIWKFFIYFIKLLGFFGENSEELNYLIDLLRTYATAAHNNENKRLSKVFMESLIDSLIEEIKTTGSLSKRERLMQLVYDFSGRELHEKKAVLSRLKESLGSNSPFYISWLSVLIIEEKSGNQNEALVADFIYYAHQNLQSPNYLLKTSALKILSVLSINGWVGLMENFFSLEENRRKMACTREPEHIYLVSTIYFCLLKNVIEGSQYQNLVKGKNQANTNTIKVYNPDHEKQTEEIKGKANSLAITIAELYHNSSSKAVREILAKESTGYVGECLPLLLLVSYHLSSNQDFQEFFTKQQTSYIIKNSRVVIDCINPENLKICCNDMLAETIKLHSNGTHKSVPSNAIIQKNLLENWTLLNFCLENLNIKKLNIELWEGIAEMIAKPYVSAMRMVEYRTSCWSTVQKIYSLIFNYDMKMAELSTWIAELLQKVTGNGQEEIIVGLINEFFKGEYDRSKNDMIRQLTQEINSALEAAGCHPSIKIQSS